MSDLLDLSSEKRKEIWNEAIDAVENYLAGVPQLPLFQAIPPETLTRSLKRFDFRSPVPAKEAIAFAVEGLRSQLQIAHPAYFGVFNPAAAPLGVVGELLTAAFNPQLASWTSAPFAISVEQHLLRWLAEKYGFPEESRGIFTSGGAEANHTALLTALTRAFPCFSEKGVRPLSGLPVFYASVEAHHSFLKAARLCGLGTESLREIPTDEKQRLRVDVLQKKITEDRAAGHLPFLVAATAGTTSHAAIDPISEMVELAAKEHLWLHVDAAWAGAAVLVPELRALLSDVEKADSLTLDTHKWFNLPMTAGIFLSRHPNILRETFSVELSPYMPLSSHESPLPQPYQESMSWSRRFQGLKFFLALAVAGEEGFRETLRHQVKMGESLKEKLRDAGWNVLNETPLPVACFEKSGMPSEDVSKQVAASGRSWVTTTNFEGRTVLRAGISNYRTQDSDLDTLIAALESRPAT